MADNEEMDLDSLLGFGGVENTSTKQQEEDVNDYGMSLDDLLAMENSSLMDVMNLGDGGGSPLVLDDPAPDAESHLATEPGLEPMPEPALLPDHDVVQGLPAASQEDVPPIIELQLDPAPEPDPEPDSTANQDRAPEEADEAIELLAFDDPETGGDDSQAVTGDEEQDLNLDFLDDESGLLSGEHSVAEDTALAMNTDQEEFQLPIISEIQGHDEEEADEEAGLQIDLTSIFGDAEEEDASSSSSTSADSGNAGSSSDSGHYSPEATDDELALFTVPDDEEMATDSSGDRGPASTNDDLPLLPAIDWNEDEDDAFALPQVIPDTQDVHDGQLANTKRKDDTISTDNDLELLFAEPETTAHQEVQAPTDTDLDDDYIGHYDSPRRSRKGIGLLVVSSLALIGLAAGGFAAYSSNMLPSFGVGAGSTPSDSSTSTPGPETTVASDQDQSSTVAKSALTEQSFVAATKNLGMKTAASVPASKDAIDRAISDVDKNTNDDTMSNLINEIVAATKSESPAEAASNKGSQILSVKASKTSKGLVFVVTSTGEMDLSVTVNVDGQVFQFPVQSSAGIATFVYDEPAPASGGYAYVVTSGSQEVSAVRSY